MGKIYALQPIIMAKKNFEYVNPAIQTIFLSILIVKTKLQIRLEMITMNLYLFIQ